MKPGRRRWVLGSKNIYFNAEVFADYWLCPRSLFWENHALQAKRGKSGGREDRGAGDGIDWARCPDCGKTFAGMNGGFQENVNSKTPLLYFFFMEDFLNAFGSLSFL